MSQRHPSPNDPGSAWRTELPQKILHSRLAAPPARHRRHCEKRNAKIATEGQKAQPATIRAHVYTDATIPTPLCTEDLPAAHGGYTVKPGTPYAAKKRWTLKELLGLGFQLVRWDG
jgi:hypothetical protein